MKHLPLLCLLAVSIFIAGGCNVEANNSGDYEMLKKTLELEESTVKGASLLDKAQGALEKEEDSITNKAKEALQNVISCDCPFEPQDCEDFLSHKDAQEVYKCCLQAFGTDIHDLDPDKDGNACELLP
jgi:hypothetical protein